MDALVDQVIDGLSTLPVFSPDPSILDIDSILHLTDAQYKDWVISNIYDEDPLGNKEVVNRLRIETVALGLSRTSDYGFNRLVKQDTLDRHMQDTISYILIPIYRKHLENHLLKTVKLDILASIKDSSFCTRFTTHVLDPDFITNSLIARFLNFPQYTEAIAYIYERCRATLITVPDSNQVKHPVTAVLTPFSAIAKSNYRDLARPLAKQHIQKIEGKPSFEEVALPIHWSDEPTLQGPSFPANTKDWQTTWCGKLDWFNLANGLIHQATRYPGRVFPGHPDPVEVPGHTVFGEDVQQWIHNQATSAYADIFTDQSPDNDVEDSRGGGGCFAPGTRVATDQGEKAIEKIVAGDRVLARAASEYSTVSDEKVVQPAIDARDRPILLWGFNGGKPFVTAGHVFFTVGGAKAIDPTIATEENPGAQIGVLSVGDTLLRLKKDRSGYDEEVISSFTAQPAKVSFVHGLHSQKGGQLGGRYHANGYWVAESYPQLTIKSIHNRLSTMTLQERQRFARQVQSLPKTFEKAFGSTVFGTFQRNFAAVSKVDLVSKAQADDARFRAGMHKRHLPVHAHDAVYQLVHRHPERWASCRLSSTSKLYSETVVTLNRDVKLPTLTISAGALLLDQKLVLHASLTNQSIQWSEEDPSKPGVWQHGYLRSIGHGYMVTGHVAEGPKEVTSADQMIVRPVFGLRNANDYIPTSSAKVFTRVTVADKAIPLAGESWGRFWKFEMGISGGADGMALSLTLPDLDAATEDPTLPIYRVSPLQNSGDNFVLAFPVSLIAGMEDDFRLAVKSWKNKEAMPGPVFHSLVFQVDLRSNVVHGHWYELKDDDSQGDMHAFYAPFSPKVRAVRSKVSTAVAGSAARHKLSLNTDMFHLSANVHNVPLVATDVLKKLSAANDLSLSDLQHMLTPDDSHMHEQAQTFMQNTATYWRSDAETSVFGDEKAGARAILPDELTVMLPSDLQNFFGDIYSRGMIMHYLATASDHQGSFADEERAKLAYFWKGKLPGCIAQNEKYSRVSKIAATLAFRQQTPGLQPYSLDTEDWAKKFYDFCTTDEMLNNLSLTMFMGSNNLANHHAMIIAALDTQGRNLEQKLWDLILQKLLVYPSNQTIQDLNDEFPDFGEQFARELITRVNTGDPSISESVRMQLKLDIAALEEEFQTKEASEIAARLFNARSELGRCFQLAIRNLGNIVAKAGLGFFQKLMKAVEDVAQKVNKNVLRYLKYATVAAGMAVQGFAIYQAIQFMMDWSRLSAQDKANAIISLVSTVTNLLADGAKFLSTMRIAGFDDKSFRRACMEWNTEVGEEIPKVQRINVRPGAQEEAIAVLEEDRIASVNSASSQRGSIAGQIVEAAQGAEVAELERTFSVPEAVAGGVQVCAAIASAIVTGFQIAEDFQKGESPGIKALDIISLAQAYYQAVIGAFEVSFMVMGVESAVVPVLGVVVAVAGIIVMFLDMFLPRKQPPDPVQQYINDHKDDFLRAVPHLPEPLLEYEATQTIPSSSKAGTVEITISETLNSGLMIKGFTVTFLAGQAKNDLFVIPTAPSSAGDDTGSDPPKPFTYNVDFTDATAFTMVGSQKASPDDDSVILKVNSTSSKGVSLANSKLKISITGTVSNDVGDSIVSIQEGIVNRPDSAPMTDVVNNLVIKKT